MTVQEETIDQFEAVGIHIRAKINRLCNEHKWNEAKVLEQAYLVLFGSDVESISQRVIDYYCK